MKSRAAERFDVSRETIERLEIFEGLLRKWNPSINLVSRATLKDAFDRHIADSLQLWPLRGEASSWVDMGAGGGFPGLVVAICAQDLDIDVTLIESDQRKCAFLRTVSRETSCDVRILSERIELADPVGADLASARALAPLTTLLTYSCRHMTPTGFSLYPKGKTWEMEVEAARRDWDFDLEVIPSQTDAEAVILKVWNLSRA